MRPRRVRLQVRQAPAFFPETGWVDTPMFSGEALAPGTRLEGPAIVREPTTTVVVYPGSTATVTGLGNYLLEIGAVSTAGDKGSVPLRVGAS